MSPRDRAKAGRLLEDDRTRAATHAAHHPLRQRDESDFADLRAGPRTILCHQAPRPSKRQRRHRLATHPDSPTIAHLPRQPRWKYTPSHTDAPVMSMADPRRQRRGRDHIVIAGGPGPSRAFGRPLTCRSNCPVTESQLRDKLAFSEQIPWPRAHRHGPLCRLQRDARSHLQPKSSLLAPQLRPSTARLDRIDNECHGGNLERAPLVSRSSAVLVEGTIGHRATPIWRTRPRKVDYPPPCVGSDHHLAISPVLRKGRADYVRSASHSAAGGKRHHRG